jgi:putative transposase
MLLLMPCEPVRNEECLDFMIPLNEWHLRKTLRSWVAYYNKGRPHSSLVPGIPQKSDCAPQKVHVHIERCNFQAPR